MRYDFWLHPVNIDQIINGDKLPPHIAKLSTLRDLLLQESQGDIFASISATVPLRDVTINRLGSIGLGHLLPADVLPAGLGEFGALMGQFENTTQQGSYNVVVTATGTSLISDTRFVRKEFVSVLAK